MVPDRLEALAVLVLALGVRQGEALELRWSDIDLDKGVMDIHGTKTAASDRQVALPPFAVDSLSRHQARQRKERMAAKYWGDPDLVFTTSIGTEIHRRNVLRWWHDLTENRAGVGRRRFHASRHTAATLMLNAGVPLEVVSATLGHAGYAITTDVYAKVRPELQRTAADAMQGVLG
jgi:integrase